MENNQFQGQDNQNNQVHSPTSNNKHNDFYVPSSEGGAFQPVGNFNNGQQGDRAPANRVAISQFTPGQKYCGVILNKIFDKQGKFGISDLYFFKRVTGGTTVHNNLQFSEVDDMIAVDSKMLKERIRAIEDGQLVILEYVGQHATKRYKIWNVYTDNNFKPEQAGIQLRSKTVSNESLANTATAATANQQSGQMAQQQPHQTFVTGNNAQQQAQQGFTSNADDDLPF